MAENTKEQNRKEAVRPADNRGGCLVRAVKADEAFIVELWREAFGDPEAYIRKFLEAHGNTETDESRAFLWKEEGACTTMLFALPAKIKENGAVKEARYLYAIATKKERRGKKYLKRILPELKKVFGEECILFLVPEPGVIPYYERLGFIKQQALPGFVSEREKGSGPWLTAASEGVRLKKITDVLYYYSLREANLEQCDHVVWGINEISWALCDIAMAQGAAYVVECGYGQYLLAGIRKESGKESSFQVIETTLPGPVFEELKTELMEKLDCGRIWQDELLYMIEQGKAEKKLYLSLALNG